MKPVSFMESVTSRSNDCVVADRHLLPTNFNLLDEIKSKIENFQMKGELFVEIYLGEITRYREFYNNTPSFGEAVEEILKEKLDGYVGMNYYSDYEESLRKADNSGDDCGSTISITDSYSDCEKIVYFYKRKPKGDIT